MMDPLLEAAIRAGHPTAHLVTVEFGLVTIRWTDRGFVVWAGQIYRARDAVYGVLDDIGDITDGIDDDGSPVPIRIKTPTLASLADLASMDAQGGLVQIHLCAVDRVTGLMIGEPYRLHFGELDQPRLIQGPERALEYDVLTGEARGLQPNEEQRQSDAFHQSIWPGELGNQFATDGTKLAYWRADEPRNAIGSLRGRGDGDDKAIQFTYEPNAPLYFPFGLCGVGGTIRYQTGYGPTNRWFSVFATVGASGPIEELISFSADDEVTSFDGSGRATNGEHQGEMWFEFLPGDQPSAALTSPTGTNAAGIPAPLWTTAHKLSGRPAYCWTGKENSKEDEYRGGVVKPLLVIKGLKGWDPGTIGCEIDDPSTWVYLEDGARAGLNWTIGRWEGSNGAMTPAYGVPYASTIVGGIGAAQASVDTAAFLEAAEIATANGWKVAGVPGSDEDKIDVLEWLLEAAGAVRIRKCGMISCFSRGAVASSVMAVTQADTEGRPEISLGPSRLDRKNTGIASFWDADHRWEMMPVAAVTNSTWRAEDGGKQTTGFEYKYVPDATQAAQLCYLDLADARERVQANTGFKLYMLAIEPGQCFTWDEPEYLLEDVKVRVLKRTYSPTTRELKLAFRQETDAKVAEALAQTGSTSPPSVPDAPPPTYVAEPTDFDTTLAGSVVTLAWRNPIDGSFYRTKAYRTSAPTFTSPVLIGSRGGALGQDMTLTNSPGTGTWYFWIQAENLEGDPSTLIGPSSEIVA